MAAVRDAARRRARYHRAPEARAGERGVTESIAELPGLGPASARTLAEIGVETREALVRRGALGAFAALERRRARRPSLNLLYAMVGALEDHAGLPSSRDFVAHPPETDVRTSA